MYNIFLPNARATIRTSQHVCVQLARSTSDRNPPRPMTSEPLESSVPIESLQRCNVKAVSILNLLSAVYDGAGHDLKGGRSALKQSTVSDTMLFLMRRCVADEVCSAFWRWVGFG